LQRLAADSETSGGLLIAVPPAREAALRQALEERGVLAQRIGAARAERRRSRSGSRVIRLRAAFVA
jgi:selenophosphate synthase